MPSCRIKRKLQSGTQNQWIMLEVWIFLNWFKKIIFIDEIFIKKKRETESTMLFKL